jgi:hypothetical protein
MARTWYPVKQNFPMPAGGIFQSVLWMLGTFVVLWYFVVQTKFNLYKTSGWVLIAVYFVYLTVQIALCVM